MDGVVDYDETWFLSIYPEFTSVSSAVLSSRFTMATALCDNTPCSRIQDASAGGLRAQCLAALQAHLLALAGLGTGNERQAGLVGRISSAGQGSVSVGVDMPSSPSAAWYNQTQYGATYWAMTAAFRTFAYFPGCPRIVDPYRP